MVTDLPARPADDVGALYVEVRSRLLDARATVARSVNETMVRTYWAIGGLLDEHVGSLNRPEVYGKALVDEIAQRLSSEFGRGFDSTNLRLMRQFFNSFEICDAPRRTSSEDLPERADRPRIEVQLSWTHYRLLTRVHDPGSRSFYMNEAIRGRWSTRELERQIATRYFERGLGAQPVSADMELADPQTLLRDPYVLEFVGLPDRYSYTERELEQALIDQLQAFLLELGRGFSFVGRQQRVTVDGDHFYVDLVFYNYLLKAFRRHRPKSWQARPSRYRANGLLRSLLGGRSPRPR